MSPTLETPVGQIVTAQPLLAKVFEAHGIDYCCGGKLSVQAVCARKGLDAQALLDKIRAAMEQAVPPELDWAEAPLDTLVLHLIETHHAYLHEAMPRLAALSLKVANVHGDRHPELVELSKVYQTFHADMAEHLLKEEQILFPAILRLAQGDASFPVQHPIRAMEAEHDGAGRDLERMRELSGGFAAPDDACNSYRALLAGLAELESDTFTHLHKENNILFPRALARLEALKA
ncbi:Iron-sulfur cluster repair protein YtfE [compost metagenome]